ncbi:hypothetical protein B1C78_09875 [Thioalkalivibrio denitrificans]|uniref:Uncharacterized protein n=1 Tax=Thioalkalivibrio denitrificans TaxID=108003 RepID=A0A1V3NFI5_9GAMM|nr:hypothetical protein [Thioalkalivibrio denitrificans]OOG23831.1 hypothetical protein B1C78_09875 [Thioalkalivibrio denitrificans]
MQTWILTGLLVLSLFANGYLLAERVGAPPQAQPVQPEAALVRDLQRLLDDLDAEPEWRYRFVSLGRFAQVRQERHRGQQELLRHELFALLSGTATDFDAVTQVLENMEREDSHYRSRLLQQFMLLLPDLDAPRRMLLLERLRLLDVDFDDFALLERLQP